jgi:hypothetical protein
MTYLWLAGCLLALNLYSLFQKLVKGDGGSKIFRETGTVLLFADAFAKLAVFRQFLEEICNED